MEPTNTRIDAIGIGDNVWVKQGKTDHMATFMGQPRKVLVQDSADEGYGREEYEVMIRWATTGSTAHVRSSSVRPVILGQRRRRQVVNHYQAEPSRQPGPKMKRKKKAIEKPKEAEKPKPPPPKESEKDESSAVKLKQASVQEFFPTETTKKKEGEAKKSPSFRFKLPTREEFMKYQEEKKKKEKNRKRKRQKKDSQVNNDNANNDETNDSKPASKAKQQSAVTSRISDNGSNEMNKSTAGVQVVVNGGIEDPNHTIDKGFRWEWEIKGKQNYKNRSKSSRPLPENCGKGQPQSWGEAYDMMVEFRRTTKQKTNYIPSDHPLLGKFVTELRSEYLDYRKHSKHNPAGTYYRKFDRDPLKDLTRIDKKRVRQLQAIGFRWKGKKTDDLSSHFDSDKSCPFEIGSDNEEMSVSSLDHDYESNDTDSEYGDSDRPRKSRKKPKQKSSISVASSSASSMPAFPFSDDDNASTKSHRKDHANDDKMLIVPSLNEISLQAKIWTNLELIYSGKPTTPMQLYRLLRVSTLQPKTGLNKLIRWTDDGNSFLITDETKFMNEIIKKKSNMKKLVSFRNMLSIFGFRMVKFQKGKNGVNRRTLQHKSIQEAKAAKDPSLRLFYRGVPLKSLRKILTKIEEAEKQKAKEEKAKAQETAANNAIKPVDTSFPNREAERKSRRTSDGCLLPKGGSELYLMEDGTYETPGGAIPKGLLWDKFRGLWAPPNLVSKGPIKKAAALRNDDQDSDGDNSYNLISMLRTSDGCLMPKNKPLRREDGSFKPPKGPQPRHLEWDAVRGLWVPMKKFSNKRFNYDGDDKDDGNDGDPSSSSSSGADATIIKASKAKLFQHSDSIMRTFLQPNKKKRKLGSSTMYPAQKFQARTKSNPSGMLNSTLNLSNWRKIERLMKRSRKQRRITTSREIRRNAHGDEGEAVLV